MPEIFLLSFDFSSICVTIIIVIFLILASDSDLAKIILGIVFGLAILGLLGYFVVLVSAPICYWFAGTLCILGFFQFLKALGEERDKRNEKVKKLLEASSKKPDKGIDELSKKIEKQDKENPKEIKKSFWTLLAKGFRDASACTTIGVAIVMIIQIALRTIFYFVSDESVMSLEETLNAFRGELKEWLEYSFMLKTLAVLLIFTIIVPQAQLLKRYSTVRNWAERGFFVIVTMSFFTFFSAEGISSYRADWSEAKNRKAQESQAKRRKAQLKILAMAYIEQEIKESPKAAKENLKKLLMPPPSDPLRPPPNPPPKKPDNSSVIYAPPQWNSLIINPPLHKIYKPTNIITPADYAKYLGKEFPPLPITNSDLLKPPTQISNEPTNISAIENSTEKVINRLQSSVNPTPTVEEFKLFIEETDRIVAYEEELESGFLEVFKNSVEELANMSDDSVLKPFVKAFIESVSEVLVKEVFPKAMDNYEKAKLWIRNKRGKINQLNENVKKTSWREKLADLFLSKKDLEKRAKLEEDKAKARQKEIDKENEKRAEIRKNEIEDLIKQKSTLLTSVESATIRNQFAVIRKEPSFSGKELQMISKIKPLYLVRRSPKSSSWIQVVTYDSKSGWIHESELLLADGSCICKFP